MSITLFGLVWLLFCVVLCFKSIKYLIGLLLFSCIFQAAAVFIIADKGISPLTVTELAIILRTFYSKVIPTKSFAALKIPGWGVWAFAFLVYAIAITLIVPNTEHNLKVLSPADGIDDSFYKGGTYLSFSSSNVVQMVLLIINIVTLYCILPFRNELEIPYLIKILSYSTLVFLAIGFWCLTAKTLGLPFPDSFFYSNTGYAILSDVTILDQFRFNSTFSEASTAGQFLAVTFWAFFPIKSTFNYILLTAISIALILTLSGSGFVVFFAGFLLSLLIGKIGRHFKPIIFFCLLLTTLYLLGVIDPLIDVVTSKMDSQSGEVRGGADLFSFRLLIDSHFLGVGLGSHRTSSFLLNTLASVGVIGSSILMAFLWSILSPIFKVRYTNFNYMVIVLYALIMLIAQFTSAPDLTSSTFWLWLFIAACYSNPANEQAPSQLLSYAEIKT